MERITYAVTSWSSDRYKAQIFVDGYPVEKSYHGTRRAAVKWCKGRVVALKQEVRA